MADAADDQARRRASRRLLRDIAAIGRLTGEREPARVRLERELGAATAGRLVAALKRRKSS